MKGVVENEETVEELEVKSCEKGKTESKVEIIKVKQQVEKTTTQKEYQNIGEITVAEMIVDENKQYSAFKLEKSRKKYSDHNEILLKLQL